MKNTLLAIAAITTLGGCASNSYNDTRIQELEINQRILAAQLGMTEAVMPSHIDYVDGFTIGNPKAPYVMIEFTDLQCPYCEKFQKETFPEFKKKYVDTGKVLFVAKAFPLKQIHPQAAQAAVALNCAAEQKPAAYSDIKSDIFANRANLHSDFYQRSVEKYGLDKATFDTCMQDQSQLDKVNRSYKYAYGLGLSSTPSFIFGQNNGTSAKNYRIAKGALTLEHIEQVLEQVK
ncbi:hypothetical protein DSB67_01160 [Vibrio campbellii]|uniref:DsbA family protein n=1 Tax=Vibrio campbellii TaxID=680 RepID=UPI00026C4BBF|nr:thioredoxin domain-containing protein [Vibrio campbellii]AXB30283.1 hypothetical protein DSB67_01160 [Vibrio campbellii]